MHFKTLAVCILWYLLVPVVGALYLCEGPNDLAAEWPTEQELRNFNETTEGVFLDFIDQFCTKLALRS